MSDLSTFAQHARQMATAEHKPECQRLVSEYALRRPRFRLVAPDPTCAGCVTDDDRALWGRLADEVDAYLTSDEEGLFA